MNKNVSFLLLCLIIISLASCDCFQRADGVVLDKNQFKERYNLSGEASLMKLC